MGSAACPKVDREEIVNACGVDDFHDGANVVRTACVIGMAKARETFEPFLQQLGHRLAHVQRRMLPISMFLLQRDGALAELLAELFVRGLDDACLTTRMSTAIAGQLDLHRHHQSTVCQVVVHGTGTSCSLVRILEHV
jgi:hypothetical protein